MYMVRSYVEGMEVPFSNGTRLTNRPLNRASRSCSKDKWTLLERFVVVVFPGMVRWQVRITVAVVKAIDRATVVSM